MSCATCRYFDECSAPLCPEDSQSLEHGSWFPDEATCRRQDLRGAAWISRQRKIARVTGQDFSRGAFTFAMLSHVFTVRGSIHGLDPDAGPFTPERMARWIREHRGVLLSAEEKAQRAARIKALKGCRSSTGKMPEGPGNKAPVPPATETVSEAGRAL